MGLVQDVSHFFALLFWFINERNYTIQSTSTILKPRKEADAYKPGDVVVAKFQGRNYNAVVVDVKDEKEKLAEVTLEFSNYLQDVTLSPCQIMQKMGINAELDSYKSDSTQKQDQRKETSDTVSQKKAQKKKTTSATPKTTSATPKTTSATPNASQSSDNVVAKKAKLAEEKQKKMASLETAKTVAAKLLQKKVSGTDDHTNSQSHHTNTSQHTHLPPQQDQNMNSSTQNDTNKQMQSIIATSSFLTQPVQTHSSNTISQSSNQVSQTSNQVSAPTQHSTFQPQTQNFQPQTQNHSPYFPSQHFQQNPSASYLQNRTSTPEHFNPNFANTTFDYNFQANSASECLANSLANNSAPQSVDCSKCMVHINRLEQRISTLETKIESLTNTSLVPLQSPQRHELQSPQRQEIQSPQRHDTQSGYQCQTFNSGEADDDMEASFTGEIRAKHSSSDVELVAGYGVLISVPQLDACLRKAKSSGTALARRLCDVFFTQEVLARSCVRGTKTRPALDSKTVNAIMAYVGQKRPCAEKDLVQAVNQKCVDARQKQTLHIFPTSKPKT